MEIYPVYSTNIEAVGYDSSDRILELKLLRGDIHYFRNVPLAIFYRLLGSESKTNFVRENIMNEYSMIQ